MADIPNDLLQVGGTASGLGLIFYMLLKLLERYSGSENYYKERLKKETERADKNEKRADDEEKKRIACQAEATTLRKQLKALHERARKHDKAG